MRIAVLGGTGMLGSMLVDYLSRRHEVVATYRDDSISRCNNQNVEWYKYLAEDSRSRNMGMLLDILEDCTLIVNAIGVIKQRATTVANMQAVNTTFPNFLRSASYYHKAIVVNIATDCVFSGLRGLYGENDQHTPSDAYGQSKSCGEVKDEHWFNLRCSIIGIENRNPPVSLLSKYLAGMIHEGYTNHLWNGITTLAYTRICGGLAECKAFNYFKNVQHLIPADNVNKYELLKIAKVHFNSEHYIKPVICKEVIDRRLRTNYPELNKTLWKIGGYSEVPTIGYLVKELAEYKQVLTK